MFSIANKHSQFLGLPSARLDPGYPKETRSIWHIVEGLIPGSAECKDVNCAQCSSDGITCHHCLPNFYKFMTGKCLSQKTVVTLSFENDKRDSHFIGNPQNMQFTTVCAYSANANDNSFDNVCNCNRVKLVDRQLFSNVTQELTASPSDNQQKQTLLKTLVLPLGTSQCTLMEKSPLFRDFLRLKILMLAQTSALA